MISRKEWEELRKSEKILTKALGIFKVEAKDLPRVMERLQREVEEMEK